MNRSKATSLMPFVDTRVCFILLFVATLKRVLVDDCLIMLGTCGIQAGVSVIYYFSIL